MENKLPKNWVECALNELALVQSGGTPSRGKKAYWNGNIPWIKISDINDLYIDEATEYITEEGLANSAARLFPKGTILFTIFATIGRIGILNIEATTNQAIAGITPTNLINHKYLTYSLIDLSNSLQEQGKGVAQKNINQAILKSTLIPLPPQAEQNRIVAKLDALFAQLETIKTSMAKVPLLLKDFRQQVLTQAVTGKLTEEWRKGRELEINYIDKINKIHVAKLKPVKVRGQKSFENESFFEIPKTWNWVPVYKLVKDGGNSICAGPFGTIFKAKDFKNEGVPIIFLRHVKKEGFNQRKPVYMDEKVWVKYHQEYSVFGGELLVTKLGDPPGEATIFPNNFKVSMVTPDIMKADFNEDIFITKFAMYFFNSNIAKDIIAEVSFGMTRLRIDLTMFKSIPIPVPTIEEQQEIVSRVESLFAKADAIEKQYETLKAKIERLPQAILHKAFKGELTEQLDSDGDARELLREIEGLKEAGKTLKSKKTKSVAKKVKSDV